MEDHKCVKEGIVQFNLGSYTNPVCTTKKVSDQLGRLGKVWDDHDLLFRYCYYPGACATADTDEKIFKVSSPPAVYLQNGIAYTFPNATSDGAPRSDESGHARLVNVVGYFDRMWYGCASRRRRRYTRGR